MPKYQFYFDTQQSEEPYRVHIEEDEILTTVLPDILSDLREDGIVLHGEKSDIYVVAAGRVLDLNRPLPAQGVKPNDVLRVSLTAPNVPESPVVPEPIQTAASKPTISVKTAQTAYRMSLAGAAGGLLAWTVTAIAARLYVGDPVIADFVARGVFGLLVGSIAGASISRYAEDRVAPARVLLSASFGVAGSLMAGAVQIAAIRRGIGVGTIGDRIVAWMTLCAFTAVAITLARYFRMPERLPVPFTCGLLGGALAGILMFLGGEAPDFLAPVAYMVGAAGATGGIPVRSFRRSIGRLLFISSGDKRTHDRHVRTPSSWTLRDGQACVFGSAEQPATTDSADLSISLSDTEIAPRHARIHAKHGRFILSRHVEIRSQAGLARFVLKVRGETIVANTDLHDSDDILLGTTTVVLHIVPEDD